MRKPFTNPGLGAAAALLLALGAFAADPKPGDAVNGLLLKLGPEKAQFTLSEDVALTGTFRNVGAEAIELPNWRAGSLLITDAQGKLVPPGKGLVLPCGDEAMPVILTPGNEHQENHGLFQTQPAGNPAPIGYRYDLLPGVYKVAFVYEVKESPKGGAWTGKIISNEITLTLAGPPAPVMAAIKAEWPQAGVASLERVPGRPQQQTPTRLWRIGLENKTGGKTQNFAAVVTEAGVVTRVRTPLQVAEVPKAISDAVTTFLNAGNLSTIEIQKANKVETRVDAQRAKLPKPVMSYEVYATGIKPAVWLYVSEDGKVSRTAADAAANAVKPPEPVPNDMMQAK